MINNIISFFQKIYQENPSVAAILGVSSAGLVTSIVYVFRSNIIALFYWLKKQFTTSFYITNEMGSEEVYNLILSWLKSYNKLYTRSLKSPQHFNIDELQRDKISDALQYGLGKNLIWFHRCPVWLYITEEKIENSRERKMSLSLSILGRSHNLIYDLLDEVYKWYARKVEEEWKNKTKVNVYGYNGVDTTAIIHKRGFDTVYLSSKIEKEIKHNIHKFFNNKDLYTKHGIPYHYGMILYGPPGTGKTSIIKAIASEFDLDISLIDPLKIDITKIKKGAKTKLLVIEDIDLLIGAKRESVEEIELELEDEDNILGNIIKVDRALYEEYEMKKTITCFDSGDYTLFFTYSIDGGKELFLLHDGYYLLEITNVTDTEITLRVKKQVSSDIESMCKHFSHLNSDNQKLGVIEDKDKYINSNEYSCKFNKEELFMHCNRHDFSFTNELDNKKYQLIYKKAFTPISVEQMENAFNDDALGLLYQEYNGKDIHCYSLTYVSFDEEYMYFELYPDNIEIETEDKQNNYLQVPITESAKIDDERDSISYDVKFDRHKLFMDCKKYKAKISNGYDNREYDFVHFEEYVPNTEEQMIAGLQDGILRIEWDNWEEKNDKGFPTVYDLEYVTDDNSFIYFEIVKYIDGKKVEFENKIKETDYDMKLSIDKVNNETEEEKQYDYKIEISLLKRMFKENIGGYELLVSRELYEVPSEKYHSLDGIRRHQLFLFLREHEKAYAYIDEDANYFYFIFSQTASIMPRVFVATDTDKERYNGDIDDEEDKVYDYSIPLNILHSNSWEKPFSTNEGFNLYIWPTGTTNSTKGLPRSEYNFLNEIIVGNLYFFDGPKRHKYTKAYKYHSHDDDNLYIVETNYEPPIITTSHNGTTTIANKIKSVDANKNSGGKKVLRDLMNAIDGLITQENFIIIATTNSIDTLDPALIRPGRFDTAIKIDYIDIEVFNKVMMRYFGKITNGSLKKTNLTISRLQVEFLMGKTFEDFCRKYISEE